jgi:hypothetical protein
MIDQKVESTNNKYASHLSLSGEKEVDIKNIKDPNTQLNTIVDDNLISNVDNLLQTPKRFNRKLYESDNDSILTPLSSGRGVTIGKEILHNFADGYM